MSRLDTVILTATGLLGVLLASAILLGFQLLRPIARLTELVGATADTRAALREYEHPHEDEVRGLIRAMDSHLK